VEREEDPVVLEPRGPIDDAADAEAIVTRDRGSANRELEPTDLARTDVVRRRGGEAIR
jgi:hypothetical protein